jgi:upstream activation factor subunit UAF30
VEYSGGSNGAHPFNVRMARFGELVYTLIQNSDYRPVNIRRKMMVEKKKKAVNPNSAFMKAMKPSEALAKIVGNEPLPRSEMTKKLWDYIKKNKLQDAENKRNINADENLLAVFDGKKQVSMFEMTKLVNKHLS